MSELTDKEKIIKDVYEDKEKGFGSVRDTYQQAYKKDPSIRYTDVKQYLDKQKHRQTQFKYKGFNSFIKLGINCFQLRQRMILLKRKRIKRGRADWDGRQCNYPVACETAECMPERRRDSPSHGLPRQPTQWYTGAGARKLIIT